MKQTGLFAFLYLAFVASLYGAELTPWEPWYWRNIERVDLQNKLPQGVQLNARPMDTIAFGSEEAQGWQPLQLKTELNYTSEIPEVMNRQGSWLAKGGNSRFALSGGWASDYVSLWAQPQWRYSENLNVDERYPESHPTVSSAVLQPRIEGAINVTELGRANLLLNWKNLLVQVGKDNLRLGSGEVATLHWDQHAAPTPLFRIGTRVPWGTSWGFWTFSHQVGLLGSDREIPNSRISGWRLGWSSDRRVELGLSRSWIVGMYDEQYNFYKLVGELYDPTKFFKTLQSEEEEATDLEQGGSGNDFRNQQLVTDGRIKFWETGTVLHWEWGREDHEYNYIGIKNRWQHTQAKIVGVNQYWGKNLEWALKAEWADTLQPSNLLDLGYSAWYNHRLSWTYDGVILGHPIGADSHSTYLALEKQGDLHSYLINYELREHGIRRNQQTGAPVTKIGLTNFEFFTQEVHYSYTISLNQTDFKQSNTQLTSNAITVAFDYQL